MIMPGSVLRITVMMSMPFGRREIPWWPWLRCIYSSSCFNLALEPSHLRHSARVLTTSDVPTHNACATKQNHGMSWVLNTLLPPFLSHGMIPFFQPDLSRWHLGILWNARFSQCRWPPIPENLKLWSCNDG